MAEKEKAAKAANSRKDVELKGVKVVYVDSPARIERIFRKRKAADPELDMGDMFVHIEIESDGKRYNGLSQTLRLLDEEDYDALLKAYADQTPIDLIVRIDDYSKKSGNYFFFVDSHTGVGDLYRKVGVDKPTAKRDDRKPIVDLLSEEL